MRNAEAINLAFFIRLVDSRPAAITPIECANESHSHRPFGYRPERRAVVFTAGAAAAFGGCPARLDARSSDGDGLLAVRLFFPRPDPRMQAVFESWDEKLFRAFRLLTSPLLTRSWFGSALEVAYLLCYPVVPLGVAALYLADMRHRVDDYWLVVLLSAYPCYVLLPFIQLLPPRSLSAAREWHTSSAALRRFNLWIVGKVTHQATTFPSGHVAASMAIALVLLRDTPVAGLIFLLIAMGISLGCVTGRYHYAVDVIAALIVAGIVFAAVTIQ